MRGGPPSLRPPHTPPGRPGPFYRHSREGGNPEGGAGRCIPPLLQARDHVVKIGPVRVGPLDQPYLPLPIPLLQTSLPEHCALHRGMGLIPDKSVDAIPPGESTDQAGLVLPDAFDQVGRDSDVQGPVSGTGENVDVGGPWRRRAGVIHAPLTVIPASGPESRGAGVRVLARPPLRRPSGFPPSRE